MKNNGFTLIELLIVIVVVGILAAIAVPTYTQYMQRGHNTEAKAALTAWAAAMYSEFMNTRQFACISPPANTDFFRYQCTVGNQTHNQNYTLSATSTARVDSKRTISFSIDSANNRQTSITSGSTSATSPCWLTDLDSIC